MRSMIFAALLVSGVCAAAPTQAAIRCLDGYQRVQGSDLATPFCQDQQVADVARSYGIRVSGDAIRNNPSRKAEVCRVIGRDIRVSQACANTTPYGNRGRF